MLVKSVRILVADLQGKIVVVKFSNFYWPDCLLFGEKAKQLQRMGHTFTPKVLNALATFQKRKSNTGSDMHQGTYFGLFGTAGLFRCTIIQRVQL